MLTHKVIVQLKPGSRWFSSAASKVKLDEETTKPAGWQNAKPFETVPGPKPLPIIGNIWRFLPGAEFYNVQLTELHKRYIFDYLNVRII